MASLETPKNLTDIQHPKKQTSFMEEISTSNGLTGDERKMLTEKFQAEMKRLAEKYAGKKDTVISGIETMLTEFKGLIQLEHGDSDEERDDYDEVDEKKKLGEDEIVQSVAELGAKIEFELNKEAVAPVTDTPVTETETPATDVSTDTPVETDPFGEPATETPATETTTDTDSSSGPTSRPSESDRAQIIIPKIPKAKQAEAIKILQSTGLGIEGLKSIPLIGEILYNMINGLYKLQNRDSELSMEEHDVFEKVVAPYLETQGFILKTPETKMEEAYEAGLDAVRTDAGEAIMSRLRVLGIPLKLSGKFLGYMMGTITDINTIPKEHQATFIAARNHYLTTPVDRTNPVSAMSALLDFTPPSTVAPAGEGAESGGKQERKGGKSEEDEIIGFTEGEKTTTLELSPKSENSFRNIREIATTILGDGVNVENMIKEEFAKNTEIDPEKKGEAVAKAVAVALAKAIRGKTDVFGLPVLEKVGTGEKEVSLRDSDFAGDLIVGVEKRINSYLPLAFGEISKRIVAEVDKKFTYDKTKGIPKAEFQETREVILASVLGNYSGEGQINYDTFESRVTDGYAGVMKDILAQAEKLKGINTNDFNTSLFASYKENSPLTIT